MSDVCSYTKRLIEVDLPIKRISAHARREKSIRHGHISTLHIWWARRPLAACRAVICASLWPDPADENCPEAFRKVAREQMGKWANNHLSLLSQESYQRFLSLQKDMKKLKDNIELRKALLDFIADFANWDNSTVKEYLNTSRILTQAAHEALGGTPGTNPLIVDPFAGGGAIPLEALRVGADAFASDLNPVAVLLNKVVLQYIPQNGQGLADKVRQWGDWIKKEAEKELAEFYPKDSDGSMPIAYLWARTIKCEGPGCGAMLPMIGQTAISKDKDRLIQFDITPVKSTKSVEITLNHSRSGQKRSEPIAKKGSATCPVCKYTTPVANVRSQLAARTGGTSDARLLAVVTNQPGRAGKVYRNPTKLDLAAITQANKALYRLKGQKLDSVPLIPHESCPPTGALGFRFQKYGILLWRDLYTPRQLVTLSTFARLIRSDRLHQAIEEAGNAPEVTDLILTFLSLALGRVNDLSASLCRWLPSLDAIAAANGGQNKMPMILDFAESNPVGGAGGDWGGQIGWIVRVIENLTATNITSSCQVEQGAAQVQLLPDDSAAAMITDPPYYAAFGYSDLSEFFHIWLRRSVPSAVYAFKKDTPPKTEEAITIGKPLADDRGPKTNETYQSDMTNAFHAQRKITKPDGVGVVVFANKTTRGWEAILESVLAAGWYVTASWPIDTERPNRQRAIGSAALQSSVHLVCRPREEPDAKQQEMTIGDWRSVLAELPIRIHDWMPRLAEEGVVGADAIFACLGPALEIFSRYSRVEKASGEAVTLKEYLEQVWAAVSKEALNMIFAGADATGFEEDARLTAMWLWTLATGGEESTGSDDTDDSDEDDDKSAKGKTKGGFSLEYDAARKIAQGLGAHLEDLTSLVEVQGETAVLLPVSARTRHLFGKDSADAPRGRPKKKDSQLSLNFEGELKKIEKESDGDWAGDLKGSAGRTILDQLHQSMILFAAGRGEALKRFLVEDGIGKNSMFWRLAQAMSALYPSGTDEKRWVDGVLARKKGLGF